MNSSIRKQNYLYTLLLLATLCALSVLAYRDFRLEGENTMLQGELIQTKEEYASTSAHLLQNMDVLNQLLATTTSERNMLEENLAMEQGIVDSMRTQVELISGTVATLKKLTNTDRELLKKYSRVYFLNENYVPEILITLPGAYVSEPDKEKRVLAYVWPFLQQMMDAGSKDGIDLRVISAYRSFGDQSVLKSTYTMTYGSNTANKFSADQGYSEHQLGSAVDFTTTVLGTKFTLFEKATAYQWLTDNAYKYGFIISYPKTNRYYVFEPWHWRFVGKKLALDLHEQQKYFYDLPQRTIDAYLPYLFDE